MEVHVLSSNRCTFTPFLDEDDRGIRQHNIFEAFFLKVFSYFGLASGIVCIRDTRREKDHYLNKGSTIKWLIRHGARSEDSNQRIHLNLARVCQVARRAIPNTPPPRNSISSYGPIRPERLPRLDVESVIPYSRPLIAPRNLDLLFEEEVVAALSPIASYSLSSAGGSPVSIADLIEGELSRVPSDASSNQLSPLFPAWEEIDHIGEAVAAEIVPAPAVVEVVNQFDGEEYRNYGDRVHLEYDERESRRRNSRRLLGAYAVDIAPVADLVDQNGMLYPNTLTEFFRRVNERTLNQAYPEEPNSLRHYIEVQGRGCFRPNHNGTHAARQVRFVEVLLDKIQAYGAEGNRESDAFSYLFGSKRDLIHNPEKIIQQMLIATFLLRSGRIGEYGENRRTLERSASIYEAYAR